MICPICARETVHEYRPFCSRRCADIDLGRWLTGSYAVPSEEEGEEDAASAAPLPQRH
ncbi:DNA gyrase inhibitor YacG [Mesobaculum littorinae]|uniref:DNA gyrase inhibitor YacG n=1 Tax=Mesobaculum littorinae TaxID=2486419 RepID=A0A438AN00_9RHOB|nr:DNA gyrase inhibitor YacG [Mesobaculum littorinae]RVV99916.1 DNA gyrase inhibitor YacG [Mesobaculum littorinae]